jgi:L-asparaginase
MRRGRCYAQTFTTTQALRAASDRGVVIVNVTQCSKGKVEAHYATGTALVEAGVIPGVCVCVGRCTCM